MVCRGVVGTVPSRIRSRVARLLVAVVAIAAVVTLDAGTSLAGDCPNSGDYTLRLAQADAAVIGEAIQSGPDGAVIEVDRVVKGSGDPDRINVDFDPVAGSLPEGRRGFLLHSDDGGSPTLTACDVVDPDELAAAVVAGTPGEATYLIAAARPFGMAVLDASGNTLGYHLGDEVITAVSLCPGGQRVALGTRQDRDPEVVLLDLNTWEALSHTSLSGSAWEVSELVCRSQDGADFDAVVRQECIGAWVASSRDSDLTIQPVPESRGGAQIQDDMVYVGTGEQANIITAYSLPSFEVVSSQEIPLDAVAVGAWSINPGGTTAAVPTTDGLKIVDLETRDIIATLDEGLTDDLELSRPILRWVDDETLDVVKPAILVAGPQEPGTLMTVSIDGSVLTQEEIAGLADLDLAGTEPVLLTSTRILLGTDGASSIPIPQDTELPRAIVALEQPVEVEPFPAAAVGTVLDLTQFASTATATSPPTTTSTIAATSSTQTPTPDTSDSTRRPTIVAIALLVMSAVAVGTLALGRRRQHS
jgi:hypothetical protein